MNFSCVSSVIASIMIGATLLVSGNLIAKLANTNVDENIHKQALVKAKKLDVNNDGLISLDELTSRPNRRFQNQSREKGSQIDEAKFNARLVVMFNRMDSNSDGMLDDVEISKPKHQLHDKDHDSRGLLAS